MEMTFYLMNYETDEQIKAFLGDDTFLVANSIQYIPDEFYIRYIPVCTYSLEHVLSDYTVRNQKIYHLGPKLCIAS
jgi:hypothetical protein